MKDKANIICFCALFVLFGLFFLLPNDKNIETLENRSINKAPEINLVTASSGEFSKQFEEFIADRVAFRTSLIKFTKGLEGAYGIVPKDAPKIVNIEAKPAFDDDDFDEDYAPTAPVETEAPTQGGTQGANTAEPGNPGTQTTPPTDNIDGLLPEDDDGADDGDSQFDENAKLYPEQEEMQIRDVEPMKAGPLLVFPDRLVEIYGYGQKACMRHAEATNGYVPALGDKGRVFSLVTPTSYEFIDEKYKSYADSEYDAISIVYDHLDGVIPVDVYTKMAAHQKEYVFFRTDHHWTALGAYYAYLAYCEAADLTPVTIDKYDRFEAPNFLGYLYSVQPSKELAANPDTVVYYELKEPIEVSNKLLYKPSEGSKGTYGMFIGGDRPIYHINTSVKNGKTCAVIKDSFGNAFVPWLAPHYEDIYVFDPREYQGSVTKTLEPYDDVDLIVLNNAFSAGSGGFVAYIKKIT